MPQTTNPLAVLGLTEAQGRELNQCLQQIADADVEPYEAMDALLVISSLELTPAGDNSRVYLMGGGLLDSLADIICICDEDWISADGHDEEAEDEETQAEHKSALELCSRALNALGSMCTFAPFLSSVLEEDLCDAPLDRDTVRTLAKHINRGMDPTAFQPRAFAPSLRVLHYPLLCAVLFWSRTERFSHCHAQAVFALSWLLTDSSITQLLVPAGLIEIIFRLLSEQLGGEGGRTTPGPGRHTPDPLAERVSVTQESLRLYTCISLQRISRSSFAIFCDQPTEVASMRLDIILRLLTHVHSFNIRAILLHILLRAVTPMPLPTGSASNSAAPRTDLALPLAPVTVAALTAFRAAAGSIGSSASSRRTSPALEPRAPLRAVPPMSASLGGSSFSYASAASSATSAASASSSRPPSAAARSTASAVTAPAPATAGEDEDDDDVGELLRDPEAGVDKTAQLEQLVDAILSAAGATTPDAASFSSS